MIKGKCLITIIQLIKMNPIWLIIAQEIKFITIVDRMPRELSNYIKYCLICFIDTLTKDIMPNLIKQTEKSITDTREDESIAIYKPLLDSYIKFNP